MSRPSANYTKREEKEDRKFCCILYPDSTEYNCELLLNRLPCFWSKFYYILHDRDIYTEEDFDRYTVDHKGESPSWSIGDPKKPHYHVVAYTDSPCMLGRAAKKFGIPSNQVQCCGKLKESVQYLIHLNHPAKYQYSKDEIITNADDLDKHLRKTMEAEEKADVLVQAIFSSEISTIAALAQFAIKNHCWDELRRGQHIYTALLHEKLFSTYKGVKK